MASLALPVFPSGLVIDLVINLEASILVPLLSSGGEPAAQLPGVPNPDSLRSRFAEYAQQN
jgi:hypothetical protein